MIPLSKSTFLNEKDTKKKLNTFITSTTKLSMGDKVKEFEETFSDWQRRKHSVMVNSGSSANLLLIQALMNLGRLKRGDKIGINALTWATNVMPLVQLGLKPIPIDVEIETFSIDIEDLRRVKRLKALFVTNPLGLSCDMYALASYCKDKNIMLLEDNCESLGSEYLGTKLGNFGLASTFSFFVGHHLSTIEGGMVCTDDSELNDMLIMTRAHGWKRNLPGFNSNDFYDKYRFHTVGMNLRPMEINGFLGLNQMQYLDDNLKRRHENALKIKKAINTNSNLYDWYTYPDFYPMMAFPVVVKVLADSPRFKFQQNNIEIRPIISGNIQRHPFWKYKKRATPNTDKIHFNGFYFPNNSELTDEEIDLFIRLLTDEN